jgi:predicted dehydrogenase
MCAGRKNYNRFEINGSKGSLAFNLERMNELEVFFTDDARNTQGFRDVLVTEPGVHPYIHGWWPPGHIIGYEHTFTHAIYDFLEAIASGKKAKPDFADGVRNQAVLESWERAARSKRWVKVAA